MAKHLSGKGITTLVTFLQDREAVKRLQVLRLLSVLSQLVGEDVVTALRSAHQLVRLKDLLQAKGKVLLEERVSAANLLANIPLTEFEVKMQSLLVGCYQLLMMFLVQSMIWCVIWLDIWVCATNTYSIALSKQPKGFYLGRISVTVRR